MEFAEIWFQFQLFFFDYYYESKKAIYLLCAFALTVCGNFSFKSEKPARMARQEERERGTRYADK